MRSRPILPVCLLGLALVIAAFWWYSRERLPLQDPAREPSADVDHQSTNPLTIREDGSTQPTASTLPETAVASADQPASNLLSLYADQKNSPVKFYGKVIDQRTNPVPAVTVRARIRQWSLVAPTPTGVRAGMIPIEKTTGANGMFTIRGIKGDGLDIEAIEKEGYQLSPSTHLHYPPSGSSLENPIIFQMWEEGAPANLLTGHKFFGVVPDGRVYGIDLLLGTKIETTTPTGDLEISISRPSGVSRKDRYDWSFRIKPVDGGIVESKAPFLYQAPESGYRPEYLFKFDASDPEWSYRVKRSFFIRSRGGNNYSAIKVEVFAYYDSEAVLDIEYAVNLDGSRNLQP